MWKQRLNLVYQNQSETKHKRPIFLICVFRDEYLLLDYFIQYYLSLGVTHFIMVDNLSRDQGPEYLRNIKNINLCLYRTEDSYKEAAFGTSWVNHLLAQHCIGHYCFTVDVDELFLLDFSRYQSLHQLLDTMESSNVNVVPVTLLDMYPAETNNSYQRGQDFGAHSPYFDMPNEEFYENRGKIYGKYHHKVGGVRKRVLDATVCIHKFPLFKYDFNPIGVAPGYHFFELGGKVLRQCDKIRLHDQSGVLLHYKFIKPDLTGFFHTRIENNQDWDNSAEYKAYREIFKNNPALCFLDKKYSRKLSDESILDEFFYSLPCTQQED